MSNINSRYGSTTGVNHSSNPAPDIGRKDERIQPSTGKQRDTVTVKPIGLTTISRPSQAGKSAFPKTCSLPGSVPRKIATTIKTGTEGSPNDPLHTYLEMLVKKSDLFEVQEFIKKSGEHKKEWAEKAVIEVSKQLKKLPAAENDMARDLLKILGMSLLGEGAFRGKKEKADYEAQFELNLVDTFLADAFQHEEY